MRRWGGGEEKNGWKGGGGKRATGNLDKIKTLEVKKSEQRSLKRRNHVKGLPNLNALVGGREKKGGWLVNIGGNVEKK